MGDFLSPKRKDVVERLRRRIDLYRRHNNGRLQAFEPSINGLYEQTRQDTLLLHQRWLDNKAKKASKHKSKGDSSGQGDQRSSSQNRGKRKPESNVEGPAPADPNLGHDPSSPQIKKQCTDHSDGSNNLQSLSVQIVQQINPKHEQSQTIETNVTVKSTINGTNTSTRAESSISTNIECKREPLDDLHCNASSVSSHTSDSTLTNILDPGVLDVEELQAILDTLEKEEGEIPPEIVREIEKFTENIPKDAEDLDIKDTSLFGNPNQTGKDSPKMQTGPYMEQSHQTVPRSSVNSMYDSPVASSVSPNMTGMNAQLPSYRPMSHQMAPGPPPSVLESTGPAAETLKQMAAQHQQQQQGNGYPMQKSSPYADPFSRNGSYPGYPNTYTNQENYYNHIPPRTPNEIDAFRQAGPMGQIPPGGIGKQGSLSYDTTKPLSHYPEPMAQSSSMPSSLQQLQNQVQSHFGRGGGQPGMMHAPPHMQMSQSQQMQLSAQGAQNVQRLQMSQSQHMHINGQAQQISVAQQQSFSMSQGMPRQPGQQQFMSEQMKMQLMREKMQRSHSQDVQRTHPQDLQRSRSQDHGMIGQQHQYMNQPPPDYKMSVANQNYAGMGHGSNPLQTMQNMVNQTSQPIPDMYSTVKTEMGQMGMGQMHSGHMPTNSMVPPHGTSGPHPASLQRTQMYQMKQMAAENSVQTSGQTRPGKSSTPVFTSAIMRGQRPPNVNVGPDGLNIGQPRAQTPDWQKMHQMQQSQRLQMSQVPNTPAPPYNSYHGTSTSSAHMQQQVMHQSMMSNSRNVPQNQADVMLQMRQQQQMRVQQQQQQSNQSQSFSPAVTMSSASHSSSVYATTNSTSAPASDFPLDFLDNAQNSGTDFFDAAPSDFNLIDELLGGK
ncbi:mastermind-like protein 2 [Lineus longissimus]|uniref:mastermind-like protein 2 n=1 Tax=Lineus longissimus TaxID=88925 RepID=UPI00315D2F46